MHALSLYLDTSVIGGYFDPEFMADTRALWRLREAGRFRFVSSVLVDQEITRAPEPVRRLLSETFEPADILPVAQGRRCNFRRDERDPDSRQHNFA